MRENETSIFQSRSGPGTYQVSLTIRPQNNKLALSLFFDNARNKVMGRKYPALAKERAASFTAGGFINFLQKKFQEGFGMGIRSKDWHCRRDQ